MLQGRHRQAGIVAIRRGATGLMYWWGILFYLGNFFFEFFEQHLRIFGKLHSINSEKMIEWASVTIEEIFDATGQAYHSIPPPHLLP